MKKDANRVTSANVPQNTGARWHKRVSERHMLAKHLDELRELRRFKFRNINAPPALAIFILMALAWIAGYLSATTINAKP